MLPPLERKLQYGYEFLLEISTLSKKYFYLLSNLYFYLFIIFFRPVLNSVRYFWFDFSYIIISIFL